ncbi:hypothetical protein VSS37_06020 [Candidatus Thiothrix sp. Deng01]|uniref:Uncharacterized protein n=1 Tax=Candidatus Thiothrix phosphatis TaxID=3112415 RepID=A0ABU6CUM2_9GAMM|nr:hypothetical protein [Candidatus Thiothrix sp. Deng01]MEB4590529.1 hypothetical protein [Candidatus Thiothrix sp. Deng01]
MSFIRETNSSMPKLMGGALVLAGSLSALSLAVNGPAVLNLPGGGFWDTVGAIGAAGAGVMIWGDRSPIAAWLGAGLLVLGLSSAGWEFNTRQAGNMVSASFEAIKEGAKAGAEAGAQSAGEGEWEADGKLTPQAIGECKDGVMAWTKTTLGVIRCTPASDGNYYKWVRK